MMAVEGHGDGLGAHEPQGDVSAVPPEKIMAQNGAQRGGMVTGEGIRLLSDDGCFVGAWFLRRLERDK